MASFHKQKQHIVRGNAGQFTGLLLLGFASVYREGFETALFLQALTLDGGPEVVLVGAGLGLLCVALIGLAIFALQMRLPVMKMLIVTGVMIGCVLLVMVGNTVHMMQVVGWFRLRRFAGCRCRTGLASGSAPTPLWRGWPCKPRQRSS